MRKRKNDVICMRTFGGGGMNRGAEIRQYFCVIFQTPYPKCLLNRPFR